MIARLLGIAVLLVAGVAKAADWRASLPAGWLVAIEVNDLATLEAGAEKLFAPWGRKLPPLGKSLAALLPGVEIDQRPWGFALVPGKPGSVSPLAYIPTDGFDALCDSLNADRADSVAVANVSGYDLTLVDLDGWVQVGLLDGVANTDDRGEKAERDAWSVEGDVRVVVSRAGLQRLAEGLRSRRQDQLDAGQGRIEPWRWPQGFDGYVDRFAPYAPVFAELAAWGKPIEVGGRFTEEDFLLSADLAESIVPRNPLDATDYAAPEGAISHAVLPFGLPPRLVELAIAWMRCRPDEIDAPEYPRPEWDALAEAYRGLLSRYHSAAILRRLPGADEPVAMNDMAVFVWDGDAASLGDALQLATLRWNQLIDAADARTPLRLEMAPLEDAEGWRISTDLFKGFGLERSPEVEAVFDRYYGGDVLAIDITRRGKSNEWLVSYGKPALELLKSMPAHPAADQPVLLEGEIRLDRWFAWKSMMDAIDMEGTLGYRPRKPMAEAPASWLRVTGGESMKVEIGLDLEAYVNAVTHWRSNEPAKLRERNSSVYQQLGRRSSASELWALPPLGGKLAPGLTEESAHGLDLDRMD